MNYVFVSIAALTLASACSSGGSGSSSSSGTTSFVSFSDIAASGDATYQSDGLAVVADYRTDADGNVISVGTPENLDGITTLMTYEGGAITGVTVRTSAGNVRFSADDGDSFDITTVEGALVATSADGARVLVLADPVQQDYEYQTFGSWQTGLTGTTPSIGAGTTGARTSASQMPTTGTASYGGDSLGQVITDGEVAVTTSFIAVDTDFDTVEVYSSDTVTADPVTGNIIAARDDLDFYAAGSVNGTGFDATIDTGTLTGTVDGHFYGDNAQEVGGVFSGTTADSTYIGAFGAVDDTR